MSYDRRTGADHVSVTVKLDQFQVGLVDEFALLVGLSRDDAVTHLFHASYGYMTMALNLLRNLEARRKLEG